MASNSSGGSGGGGIFSRRTELTPDMDAALSEILLQMGEDSPKPRRQMSEQPHQQPPRRRRIRRTRVDPRTRA